MLGAAAFLLHAAISPDRADSNERIVVDDANLVRFIANRSPEYDESAARATLQRMPDSARTRLIEEFIRSEALYREAIKLGLDRGDYAIRRRLVQQMEHVVQSLVADPGEPSTATIAAYHTNNARRYVEPASVTFAHVFLAERAGESNDATLARAKRLREQLSREGLSPIDAAARGDRFAFSFSYVQRTAEDVAADLGTEAQQAIFALPAAPGRWQGPIRSQYGWHLVMVLEHLPESKLSQAQLQNVLLRDVRKAQRDAAVAAAIDEIVKRYAVEMPAITSGSD